MSLAAQLLAILAPPACVACRAPVAAGGASVCAACLGALPWLAPEAACRRCGLTSHGGRRCPATRAAFDSAWAPLAYQGSARALVRALKFDAALPLASLMAAQLAVNMPPWARGSATVVVAVPADARRRRARGFDPAQRLAAELAPRLGLPSAALLVRRGHGRQLGAGRRERREPGRVRVQAPEPVTGDVLLVDDVHTTGATLDACARALKAAGALRVHAITYARTP